MLGVLAVRLHVHGSTAGARPLMLVANHVSWIDIFAINTVLPVRFVAKSEVRSWPLLGWLSERVGTVFIRRARRHDTGRVNTLVKEGLAAGDVFAVFPEGTTTDGAAVLPFHASLLAPALEALAAIQPIAIRYERADGSLCAEAAYDGERTLWDSLIAITGERVAHVHLWFLAPVRVFDRQRRHIASEAREAIVATLSTAPRRSRTETAADLPAAAR